MKKLLTLIAIFVSSLTVNALPVYTIAPSPSTYCENTQITLNFYLVGLPFNSAGFYYKVYINFGPFSSGTPLGINYSPDSIGASSIHYLKRFSIANPGAITVTIPSGFVGTPRIGVTLVAISTGNPTGQNNPMYGHYITVYGATVSTPTITASGSTTICPSSSVTLTSSSEYAYSWSPGGATTASIVVQPSATTTYSVTVSNLCGGAAQTSSQTISVMTVPTASISPSTNQSICPGGSKTLTASGGTYYLWSTGSTTANIVVSTAGSYYAVVSNGCSSQDVSTPTVTVVVNQNPTIIVTPASTTVCSGSQITLSALGGILYQWITGGQTTSSIVIAPTTNASYSVTGTNAGGCTNVSFASVVVVALPIANAGLDKTIISGNSATIGGASSGGSYSWSTGATTQSVIVNPTVTTTYTLIVTGQCGVDTDSVAVVVVTNPTGIFENTNNNIGKILLFPNPATTEVSVGLSEDLVSKNIEVSLYDIQGNKVLSQKYIYDNNLKVDVSNLNVGNYMIMISSDGFYSSSKLVIVK